jgi:glycopeptide antibiotics resistance protein
MNWRKIVRVTAIFYLSLYAIAMLLPRKLPSEEETSSNTLQRIAHQLLYYSGPMEPVANFFLLVPVLIFLISILGGGRENISLFICISLSATAEFLQQFIPGRVSSPRDFLLNSLGAVCAFTIYKVSKLSRLKI